MKDAIVVSVDTFMRCKNPLKPLLGMGLLVWIIMLWIIPTNVAPAWVDSLLLKDFGSKAIVDSQFRAALMNTKLYISEVTKDPRTAYRSALGLALAAKTMQHAYGRDKEWLPILVGVAKVESSFNPSAISNKNAVGLMQVHWPTWGKILTRVGISKKDMFDPVLNAYCGAIILLQYLRHEKGTLRKALYRYLGRDSERYVTAILSEAVSFIEFRNKAYTDSHEEQVRWQQGEQNNSKAANLTGMLTSLWPEWPLSVIVD